MPAVITPAAGAEWPDHPPKSALNQSATNLEAMDAISLDDVDSGSEGGEESAADGDGGAHAF